MEGKGTINRCHSRQRQRFLLTGAHKLGERGQEPLDADAAHVDKLASQESLPVPSRDRRRKNHLQNEFDVSWGNGKHVIQNWERQAETRR